MSRCSRFRALRLCLAFLVLAGLGCSSSYSDFGPGPQPEPPNRGSVDKTIEYFELVWRHQLFTEYDEVLHDQFAFFPLERDAQDFPWMKGPSWGKPEELNIAAHMFDPQFSGTSNPVEEIEITLTELSRRDLGTDHVEVLCTQQGRVLTSESDGWSFDTRVLIEFVKDPDEPSQWQILKQTEVDLV